MKDPYVVLGVERTASKEVIKKVYRQKAKKVHPDLNPGNEEAHERFAELSNAYEILQDDQKRALYDQYGEAAFENGGGGGFGGGFSFDMNDIFGDLFGDLFGMGMGRGATGANQPRPGSDIRLAVDLTFKEAVFGVKKEIHFDRMENCPSCHGEGLEAGTEKKTCPDCEGKGVINRTVRTPFGTMVNQVHCSRCGGTGEIIDHPCKKCKGTGQVKKEMTFEINIPAGVDDGNIIPLYGKGNAGFHGGPAGDAMVILRVENSSFYQRYGKDLYFEMPISFSQAALGDTLELPTLTGKEEFDLPPGTQTGTRFTLKGKGIADVRGRSPGNLYFTVHIEVPKKLKKDQREALLRFANTMGEEVESQKKSFWDNVKDLFEG